MDNQQTPPLKRSGTGPSFAAPFALVRAVVLRDWRSLQVTLVACAVAAVVTAFQYQVYTSFVRAGSVGPRFIGGSVWVSAGSIECFDFPGVIGEDYAGQLARYFPSSNVRRVAFGFAGWTSPSGRRGNVAVIGIDDALGPDGAPLADNAFLADRSDLSRLDLTRGTGQLATLGAETMQLGGTTDRLPTFLGAPYVVTGFDRARSLLRPYVGMGLGLGFLSSSDELSNQAGTQFSVFGVGGLQVVPWKHFGFVAEGSLNLSGVEVSTNSGVLFAFSFNAGVVIPF